MILTFYKKIYTRTAIYCIFAHLVSSTEIQHVT